MHGLVDVRAKLLALYGQGPPLITHGVVHVTSATRGPEGRLHVLKIDADAPKSETDFFVLNLCRARADVILTSAQVVRAEPELSHALAGPFAAGLSAYRAQQLHKPAPPSCGILTRTGELPSAHPLWHDGTPKLLLTEASRVQALQERHGARAQVLAAKPANARGACSLLRKRGFELVSVEAGPGAAAALYDAPSMVDELLLSLWCPRQAAPVERLGGPLPEDARLFAGRQRLSAVELEEAGGRFRFERWTA